LAKKKRPTHSNKYENLSTPQAQIDLHLTTTEEAIRMIEEFIHKCVREKLERVLIITGKGIHSKNGKPILKPAIEKQLRNMEDVQSVSSARRDRGGDGALEVKLYN